uniref:Uncharacterized protein n=1 Tax=Glossina pallidipes TaxID=7398 RepID=A0A1A9ZY19_GLOPL
MAPDRHCIFDILLDEVSIPNGAGQWIRAEHYVERGQQAPYSAHEYRPVLLRLQCFTPTAPWRRALKRASVDVVGSSFSSNPWKSSKSSDGTPSFASTGTPSFASTGTPSFASTGAPSFASTGTPSFASTGTPSFVGTSPRDSTSAVILATALIAEKGTVPAIEL